ncbi:MAG: hypothetical protein ABI400_09790, partial [Lacisediminihabitans sp.]
TDADSDVYDGPMKRISFDGRPFVTGGAVADALAEYAVAVARMNSGATVDIPVLEENGLVVQHTFVLNGSNAIEILDVDGIVPDGDEETRFPIPEFTPIGGKAVAVSADDVDSISVPIAETEAS